MQSKEHHKQPYNGQRHDTLPTAAHQALLDQTVHQSSEQGWWLFHTFPGLTREKLKAGIFDGPQIRKLIRDAEYEHSMNEVELEASKAFVLVIINFLGNNKARNYAELVINTLTAFRNLGCNMNIKMHYLFSHMGRFPDNRGSMNDEQGQRFHQDMKEMKTMCQGRWDAFMMVNCC